MRPNKLDQRLRTLESKAVPVKFRLRWYDEEQVPSWPGVTRIQLKWLDEIRP